ncbi:restriction endonuclease [Vibrio harveyi]|uniref:Restriction endonuclease n=1 Tax=Vibrio harveyi TaxID=669 RepID=A0ABM5Y3B1_VIBHA|nr:restriction endonuclease subunit S [Vibrio harveyi]AMG00277.1 restriction endonuclease [Vibrio harveyi]
MSWPVVSLSSVATINPRCPKDIDENQLVSFVAMASASEEGILLQEEIRVLGDTKKGFTYFEKEDVLLAKITPCFENGKSLRPFQISKQVGFGSTEFHVVRADEKKLLPQYLFYLLWSNAFRFAGEHAMSGAAGQKRVGTDFLKDLEIPLPPLDEQKRIAVILDKADAIRQKRKQAIVLADEFLRSVFLEMFGDPVTNPKGFPLGTIRDLVESANYGTSGKASESEGEYPVLRMGNITYQGSWDFSDLKYIDLAEKELPKYLVHKGDLLFNRTNSRELVGKTAVYEEELPMAFAGYLVRVRANEMGNTYYLSGYLNSGHGKKVLSGMCKSIVGMANINAQELQNIKLLLPPIELQNRYEEIVKAVRSRVSTQIVSLTELNELFSSLSQKAFSGQL